MSSDGITQTTTVYFDDKDIPHTRKISGELLGMSDLLRIPMSLLMQGTHLIVTDRDPSSLIHVIDVGSNKYIKATGKKALALMR